jgi:FemAB-related protein (PEP-CTERM system-associated)
MNQSSAEIASPKIQPIVRQLQDTETERWTSFVAGHPDANLYHTLLWRDVIKDVFSHRPLYLFSERDGNISGILPLFLVKFPLLGSKLISIPYDIGSGGALAEDGMSERLLIERAISLAREKRVGYLELRYGRTRPALADLPLQQSEPVLISEIDLDGEEQVWSRIGRGHRESIRKAEKRGVTVREATNLDDFLQFYQVYLRSFRAFGTPPYGANYFSGLWNHLHATGATRLVLAFIDNRCVGGLLLFCWGTNLISKFSICLPEAVSSRTYAALQWQSIQIGLEYGYRKLNLGSSSHQQQGIVKFKERWGARTHPAALYSLPVRTKVPSIEKYFDSEGIARRLWKKLPLRTTSLLGGPLNRWFC